MDVRKLQESIKTLELENAKNVALRDNAVKELCSLLKCEEAGIDKAIETLQKRKEAGEAKIAEMEGKIMSLIPDNVKARFAL
jgi:hypothetical protein